MIQYDFVDMFSAVVISTSAAWYAGFYFERKKARKAFAHYAKNTIFTVGKVIDTSLSMVKEHSQAELDMGSLAQELIKKLSDDGVEIKMISEEEAKKLGVKNVNEAQ